MCAVKLHALCGSLVPKHCADAGARRWICFAAENYTEERLKSQDAGVQDTSWVTTTRVQVMSDPRWVTGKKPDKYKSPFHTKSLKRSPIRLIPAGSPQLMRLVCKDEFVLRERQKEKSRFVCFQGGERFSFLLMPISIRPLLRGSRTSGTFAEGIRLILLCPLQRFIVLGNDIDMKKTIYRLILEMEENHVTQSRTVRLFIVDVHNIYGYFANK